MTAPKDATLHSTGTTAPRAPDVNFNPWWWEAAAPNAPRDTVLPQRCDVAVVGGGYTGASAALTLARAGRDVLLLDAEAPGFGASSRNGGMIGSGHRLGLAALSDLYGRERALAILREGLASLDFTTQLIESEGIDCDFRRCGRFRGAWRPADYDAMTREAETLGREIGLETAVVPRGEQHREVATDCYHGGVVYLRHGAVHPAKLHCGLLALARDAGATVVGHTPVTGLVAEDRGFRLSTPRGSVTASEVVLASNGYTGAALPWFQRRLLPVSSYIVATEALPEETVRRLIPGGRMIVETRSRHCYYRASPDGRRLLLGARAALRRISPAQAAPRNHRLLVQLFPELAGVRLSHAWSGYVCFPRDQMPQIGVRDGIHFALGYSGSGVAMAPYLGHKVALKLLGDRAGATAFDDRPFPPIPFYAGRPWFLPFLDLYYRMRDRLEGSA